MPAVTGHDKPNGLSSISDVITFDHNWHPLYSTFEGGKGPFIFRPITLFRVIGLMEPEICTKMLKNLSGELRAKFPVITCGYSMVKIACLDDTFLDDF